ncbi:MAG: TonB family protein [Thermodesulfobacteriota bacterium]
MLRLALAFCVALVFHLFLFRLPLPDHSSRPSLPICSEITVNLTPEIRNRAIGDKDETERQSSRQEPEKDSGPTEPETGQKAAEPGKKENRPEQPIKRLRPVNFKKKPQKTESGPGTREPAVPAPPKPGIDHPPKNPEEDPQTHSPERKTEEEKNTDAEDNSPPQEKHAAIQKARPLYRENPPPSYPDLAKSRGWQGRVILTVEISPDGRVKTIAVKESSGFSILDQAALKAVKDWRFRPGQRNGRAVAMEVNIPVRFKIKGTRTNFP